MSDNDNELSISELPGRLQDINADDIGAACLALKYTYENHLADFAINGITAPSIDIAKTGMLQAMGRLDRLFMALMQHERSQVVVWRKP